METKAESMKLSVILQAQNEEKTIGNIIKEVKLLHPTEIIVVVNGSTDHTGKIVKSMGCKVIEYPQPIGINVGKAIGARYAIGDILLVMDSDIVIKAERLLPFIQAIQTGYHIALNNLTWTIYRKIKPHPTAVSKRALNIFLKRQCLFVNTFGAIPYALSRKAVEEIGWWNLADPPLAQAISINKQLRICAPQSIDVISTNRIRPEQHHTRALNSPYPRSTSRIIGDHLKAIHYLISENGIRGGFPDGRSRKLLESYTESKRKSGFKYSGIISIENQPKRQNVLKQIRMLKDIGITEIIVAAYELDQSSADVAIKAGATVLNLPVSAGQFVTRALGAAKASGETILFLDANQTYSPKGLKAYLKLIKNGADIVLNNNKPLLHTIQPIDPLSSIQYFLNLSLKQPSLFNNSLTATPHAIRRRVITKVGVETLMVPPLALVKALINGCRIRSTSAIKNVDIYRDFNKMSDILIGDHIEALHYYLSHTNERGNFTDGNKDRKLLDKMRET